MIEEHDFMFDDGWQECDSCGIAIEHWVEAELACFEERGVCCYCAAIEDDMEKRSSDQ